MVFDAQTVFGFSAPSKVLTIAFAAIPFALFGALAHAQSGPGLTDLKSPQDGGVRRWQLVGTERALRKAPALDAHVIAVLEGGAVLRNLGCVTTETPVWCHVRPLRGGARGYLPADQLEAARGPDGIVAMGVDDSKQRARKGNFDTRAEIQCAQEQGEALGRCAAGISRSGGGDATVVVTFPNGFKRSLFFAHGEFLRASATMSGVGTDTDWQLDANGYSIRVDDQRYTIKKALIIKQ